LDYICSDVGASTVDELLKLMRSDEGELEILLHLLPKAKRYILQQQVVESNHRASREDIIGQKVHYMKMQLSEQHLFYSSTGALVVMHVQSLVSQ
jgi:hypothetical protein